MSKLCVVTGNVTDLTAQVVGAAVRGVFAGRGQRALVTVLECSRWLGGTTAFSGGGIWVSGRLLGTRGANSCTNVSVVAACWSHSGAGPGG
jgi:hypothetical protein